MCKDPKGGSSHREIRTWISEIRIAADVGFSAPLTKGRSERLHEIARKAEALLARKEGLEEQISSSLAPPE